MYIMVSEQMQESKANLAHLSYSLLSFATQGRIDNGF